MEYPGRCSGEGFWETRSLTTAKKCWQSFCSLQVFATTSLRYSTDSSEKHAEVVSTKEHGRPEDMRIYMEFQGKDVLRTSWSQKVFSRSICRLLASRKQQKQKRGDGVERQEVAAPGSDSRQLIKVAVVHVVHSVVAVVNLVVPVTVAVLALVVISN